MKAFFTHILAILRLLWTLPVRQNNLAREFRLLQRRMDWLSGASNRRSRRKINRMLTNPRSPFYYTKPRSPLYTDAIKYDLLPHV